MMRPERTLTLVPRIPSVIEAQGHAYLTSGGTSIEIPTSEIPRIASELLVSMERLSDAASEPWT